MLDDAEHLKWEYTKYCGYYSDEVSIQLKRGFQFMEKLFENYLSE